MTRPTIGYHLLKQQDGFEIRLYSTQTIVDANLQTPFIKTGRKGFPPLVRYIRGANRTQQDIAMTRPVLTTPTTAQTFLNGHTPYTFQFFLPEPWTADTAPLPNDARLSVLPVASRKIASLTYSGFWSKDNFDDHAAVLHDKLKRANLEAVGAPILARYNSPNWPLWFMRRNEVWIEVA